MNAIDVYKFILKEMNGWSQERLDELTYGDIEGDPIFEKLKELEGENEQNRT
jgi:hypothetical protein